MSNFVKNELSALGCTVPSSCPDQKTLSDFWRVSQAKAQGLEAVYPEMWLMDLKAAADLAKIGGKALLDSGLTVTEKLTAIKNIENNFYKDGAAVQYGGSTVITNPNEAIFWSGRTGNYGGMDTAKEIAAKSNGRTLEQLIQSRQIEMPAYDPTIPSSVQAWQDISKELAKNASGDVRVVLGSKLRPDNIWETYELPTLKNNPAVTKIIAIDPKTGNQKIIYSRYSK